jgi:hypothetical protein
MTLETFAERKRRENQGGAPKVYVYDKAPAQLRHQISLAIVEGIGTYELTDRHGLDAYEPDNPTAYECWQEIDRACRKEILRAISTTGLVSLKFAV